MPWSGGPSITKSDAGLAIGCEFRADTRISRIQPRLVEARIIAADGLDERLEMTTVETVVLVILPDHVGSESGLSGKIQGHVHTESSGLGHRVDQAPKR